MSIKPFLLGFGAGGALLFGALQFHIVKSRDGLFLVPRSPQAQIGEVWADTRLWSQQEWDRHPHLVQALHEHGASDLIQVAGNPTTDAVAVADTEEDRSSPGNRLDEMFDDFAEPQRRNELVIHDDVDIRRRSDGLTPIRERDRPSIEHKSLSSSRTSTPRLEFDLDSIDRAPIDRTPSRSLTSRDSDSLTRNEWRKTQEPVRRGDNFSDNVRSELDRAFRAVESLSQQPSSNSYLSRSDDPVTPDSREPTRLRTDRRIERAQPTWPRSTRPSPVSPKPSHDRTSRPPLNAPSPDMQNEPVWELFEVQAMPALNDGYSYYPAPISRPTDTAIRIGPQNFTPFRRR